MGYARGFFVSGCIGLAGTGGGVIVLNLHTASPRLMAAGILSALIGIVGGGIGLGMGGRRN